MYSLGVVIYKWKSHSAPKVAVINEETLSFSRSRLHIAGGGDDNNDDDDGRGISFRVISPQLDYKILYIFLSTVS